MMEAGKQAKINQITEAYEQEMAGIKKTFKRVKQIRVELLDLTEGYQKNVLERTDELEQLGQLKTQSSKNLQKKIIDLSKLVPPVELDASLNNLETKIQQKLAEMNQKIKNLKPKKKNKSDKKTIDERVEVLSDKKK